jgi:hypothetical protein
MTHEQSPSDPPTGLRASDADRERVAEALRRHHLDGRLDTDELQARLGACYAARTDGELDALLADLPGERRTAPPGGAGGQRRAGLASVPLAALLVVAAVFLTLAAAAHGHPNPLPLIAVFLLLRFGGGPWRRRRAWGPRG